MIPEWMQSIESRLDGPLFRVVVLDVQLEPWYRPAGRWCLTRPGLGTPLLFSFPQPLHPLECLAALNGFGGWSHDIEAVKRLMVRRVGPWVRYTAVLAEYLNLTPQRARLAYHHLTPLNVSSRMHPWLPPSSGVGPYRENFWEECDEDYDRTSPQGSRSR